MILWTEALVATSEIPQTERANSVWAAVCQSLSVMSHDYDFVVQALKMHLQRMQDQQPQQTNAPNKRSRKAFSKNDKDMLAGPSVRMLAQAPILIQTWSKAIRMPLSM